MDMAKKKKNGKIESESLLKRVQNPMDMSNKRKPKN